MRSHEFCPDWVSAPGDTILDILQERKISKTEFSRQIEQTTESTNALLQGRATVTLELARRLERTLGASVEFWMSRDYQYRQDIARIQEGSKEFLNELPIGDMIKFGWLKIIPHPLNELQACLNFFGVKSLEEWNRTYTKLQGMFAFRTSPTLDSKPLSVAAWLRQGEIQAQAMDCAPWNAERFRESLLSIRPLTREKDPSRFLPKLQKYCAESGVAVVIVRCPNGCRASGATTFLTPDKAVLILSFRFLSDDHFWFSFFHEAGHLLLHGQNKIFLEMADSSNRVEEQEANEFAAQALVPVKYQSELLGLKTDSRQIIKFAMKVGVSPGIIVGQLQHLKKLKPEQLNTLKRRYNW